MGASAEIGTTFYSIYRLITDAILPPRCLSCGVQVMAPGALCGACWDRVCFLTRPCCATCGFPFAYDQGDGALCAACLATPPLFSRMRAAIAYDDASRDFVLAFKHGDRTEQARPLANWLFRAGRDILADADLIVPVPLERWRLFRRRYNQSALLAQAIARQSGVPAALDLLERHRRTRSQGRLSIAQRRRNVAGAFRVHARWRGRLARRRLVLVDDVYTTGATVEACSRALLRAGAADVDVLTLARVVRPARSDI